MRLSRPLPGPRSSWATTTTPPETSPSTAKGTSDDMPDRSGLSRGHGGTRPERVGPPLRLMDGPTVNSTYLVPALRALAADGRRLTVVEAGCGRHWPLRLDGMDYRLVGIDIDPVGLAARTDLDESHLAD